MFIEKVEITESNQLSINSPQGEGRKHPKLITVFQITKLTLSAI